MDHTRDMEAQGPFDARYLAFLETITQLRPRLHRYCSRMTGSVMDGEDVAQEALFEAYRKLDQYDESRPLTPWLFKIAHNRCILTSCVGVASGLRPKLLPWLQIS
jgi:RNA polymerase sigma-70 factor, ECF subfamily